MYSSKAVIKQGPELVPGTKVCVLLSSQGFPICLTAVPTISMEICKKGNIWIKCSVTFYLYIFLKAWGLLSYVIYELSFSSLSFSLFTIGRLVHKQMLNSFWFNSAIKSLSANFTIQGDISYNQSCTD